MILGVLIGVLLTRMLPPTGFAAPLNIPLSVSPIEHLSAPWGMLDRRSLRGRNGASGNEVGIIPSRTEPLTGCQWAPGTAGATSPRVGSAALERIARHPEVVLTEHVLAPIQPLYRCCCRGASRRELVSISPSPTGIANWLRGAERDPVQRRTAARLLSLGRTATPSNLPALPGC